MPSNQTQRLLDREANQWLERNRHQLGKRDPVTDMIHEAKLKPTAILEIGCSNGWRLKKLKDEFGCIVAGVEPSEMGVKEANEAGLEYVFRGTADKLPFGNDQFDLVIMGFCMYFVEPRDLFQVAMESDRVLKDNSYLLIWDFVSPRPFKRVYSHDEAVWSYHYDPPALWLGHPAYTKVLSKFWTRNFECVSLLYKHMDTAFPAELPEVET